MSMSMSMGVSIYEHTLHMHLNAGMIRYTGE